MKKDVFSELKDQERELYDGNDYFIAPYPIDFRIFDSLQKMGDLKVVVRRMGKNQHYDVLYVFSRMSETVPIGYIEIEKNKLGKFHPLVSTDRPKNDLERIGKIMKYDSKKDEKDWLKSENLEEHKQLTYEDLENIEIEPYKFLESWKNKKLKVDCEDGYPKKATINYVFDFNLDTQDGKVILTPIIKGPKGLEESVAEAIVNAFANQK